MSMNLQNENNSVLLQLASHLPLFIAHKYGILIIFKMYSSLYWMLQKLIAYTIDKLHYINIT